MRDLESGHLDKTIARNIYVFAPLDTPPPRAAPGSPTAQSGKTPRVGFRKIGCSVRTRVAQPPPAVEPELVWLLVEERPFRAAKETIHPIVMLSGVRGD
jgi:hypothetical protein